MRREKAASLSVHTKGKGGGEWVSSGWTVEEHGKRASTRAGGRQSGGEQKQVVVRERAEGQRSRRQLVYGENDKMKAGKEGLRGAAF